MARLTKTSSNEEILAVLNETAEAVSVVLRENKDWSLSGLRDTQYSVDLRADSAALEVLHGAGVAVLSEESEITGVFGDDDLCVVMDPLDGSSNIDVNVSVGTIFSVFRRKTPVGTPVTLEDFLQPGTQQVAAGYVIYGSSTMFVYATRRGVNGFTLDPSIGEFCLSHPNIKIPEDGFLYSINEGNYVHFPEGVKQYIKFCQVEDEATKRPYTSRYIGSMVADLHRNLIKGGIYIYPTTASAPKGKLRLVYECNPLAFIIEQAGGRASNGYERILDIDVTEIHQRESIFIGSKNMVLLAEEYMAKYSPKK